MCRGKAGEYVQSSLEIFLRANVATCLILDVSAVLQGQVVMVDDVITAGTTVRETIAMLETLNAKLTAIIIAFDRQEKGSTDKSAIQEAVERFNVPVQSIITLNDLIFYLEDKPGMQEQLARIREYQERYGT